MNGVVSKKINTRYAICIAILTLSLTFPLTCLSAEYSMRVDFSPKIINIESGREGAIRVFTNMRYSAFVADGHSIFIYFNDSGDSVPDIRATRDSLGNLILRFGLEDLLVVEGDLLIDALNSADAVVVMNNGDEYSGSDGEVHIVDKNGP